MRSATWSSHQPCRFSRNIKTNDPRTVVAVDSTGGTPRPCYPGPLYDSVPPEEFTMLKWLLSVWRRLTSWTHRQPAQGSPPAETVYQRSNLHGRYR